MPDSTPNLITEAQFNQAVGEWAIRTRDRIRRNAPVGYDSLPDNEKLVYTQSSTSGKHGVVNAVKFSFERHGVFVHYGVGNGYVRKGNQIVRGRRATAEEKEQKLKRGYTRKEAGKWKIAYTSGPIMRKPVDWFDVEIRTGIKELADVAQAFYGDKAMKKLLEMINRATIEKK